MNNTPAHEPEVERGLLSLPPQLQGEIRSLFYFLQGKILVDKFLQVNYNEDVEWTSEKRYSTT